MPGPSCTCTRIGKHSPVKAFPKHRLVACCIHSSNPKQSPAKAALHCTPTPPFRCHCHCHSDLMFIFRVSASSDFLRGTLHAAGWRGSPPPSETRPSGAQAFHRKSRAAHKNQRTSVCSADSGLLFLFWFSLKTKSENQNVGATQNNTSHQWGRPKARALIRGEPKCMYCFSYAYSYSYSFSHTR